MAFFNDSVYVSGSLRVIGDVTDGRVDTTRMASALSQQDTGDSFTPIRFYLGNAAQCKFNDYTIYVFGTLTSTGGINGTRWCVAPSSMPVSDSSSDSQLANLIGLSEYDIGGSYTRDARTAVLQVFSNSNNVMTLAVSNIVQFKHKKLFLANENAVTVRISARPSAALKIFCADGEHMVSAGSYYDKVFSMSQQGQCISIERLDTQENVPNYGTVDRMLFIAN